MLTWFLVPFSFKRKKKENQHFFSLFFFLFFCFLPMCAVHLVTLLSPHQYGFQAGLSCASQLIQILHTWVSALDKGKTCDVVFLHIEKAFDSVPHVRLILKLWQYGICGQILEWLSDFLVDGYQRVVPESESSNWTKVSSGILMEVSLNQLIFVVHEWYSRESVMC